MRKLRSNVYLETRYPGVALGAVASDDGLLLVDAPLRGDDAREWLAPVGAGGGASGILGGNAAAAGRTSDPAAAPARPDLRLHVGCPAGGRDRFHRGYGDGCRAALPGRRSVGGLADPTGGTAWVGLSFLPVDRRARRCHRARGPQ